MLSFFIASYVLIGVLIPSLLYVFEEERTENMPREVVIILFGIFWPVGLGVFGVVMTGLAISYSFKFYKEKILDELKKRRKARAWLKENEKAFKQPEQRVRR